MINLNGLTRIIILSCRVCVCVCVNVCVFVCLNAREEGILSFLKTPALAKSIYLHIMPFSLGLGIKNTLLQAAL